MPFWRLFTTDLGHVLLLRIVTLAVHALVGIGLYSAVRRQWNDGRAALGCATLWMLARAPLEGLSNANLTNVFGQGVFGTAMAGVGWLSAGAVSVVALAGTGLSIFVAFLSHFGTTMVGLPLLGAVSVALMVFGRGAARRAGVWVLALTLIASAASYVVYYSHFTTVFRQTFERVTARQPEPPTKSKLVAPPGEKLKQWYVGTGDDYGRPGLPLLATALAGAVLLARRRRRDGVTLVLAGWGLVWVAFTALGVFSPISIRVNLAAAPVFRLPRRVRAVRVGGPLAARRDGRRLRRGGHRLGRRAGVPRLPRPRCELAGLARRGESHFFSSCSSGGLQSPAQSFAWSVVCRFHWKTPSSVQLPLM